MPDYYLNQAVQIRKTKYFSFLEKTLFHNVDDKLDGDDLFSKVFGECIKGKTLRSFCSKNEFYSSTRTNSLKKGKLPESYRRFASFHRKSM